MQDRPRQRLSEPTPGSFPVLPLRDAVHFPWIVSTIHVARQQSLRALEDSLSADRRVYVVSQKDMAVQDPTAEDLYEIGTVCEAMQAIPLPDGSQRLTLRGLYRAETKEISLSRGAMHGSVVSLVEVLAKPGDSEIEGLVREILTLFASVVQMGDSIPPEVAADVSHLSDYGLLADSIAHYLPIKPMAKQRILAEPAVVARLWALVRLLKEEEDVLKTHKKIQTKVEDELSGSQRAFYLREQMRVIQDELEKLEDRTGEAAEYVAKFDQAGMPTAVRERAEHELRRLERMPESGSEGGIIRAYLDTLCRFPWQRRTEDRLDLSHAAELLDENHLGLDGPKRQILEYLAVQVLRARKAPEPGGSSRVLLFLGPPGVGKTTLARSIARSMNREFSAIALGGIRDEAEIRGHRRTYVGAMPGRVVQALLTAQTSNPVVLLDEIDKLGLDGRGDSVAALLEVLDAEQSRAFIDHFMEVPVDLSQVLFIATANYLEAIPHALRDRLEVIQFEGYTDSEKLEIAKKFVVPGARRAAGLDEKEFLIDDEALGRLMIGYTREAGARALTRAIQSLTRKAALQIAQGSVVQVTVTADDLESLLGPAPYGSGALQVTTHPGSAWGLFVSMVGGEVLPFEVSLTSPLRAEAELLLTGNLGGVMKERALAALTYLRSIGFEQFGGKDIHLHVPEGATPKDGPSGGLAMALALASAALGQPVPGHLAMTGEITLRGRVLAVGGLREKVLAAARSGIRTVLAPRANAKDIQDLPAEATGELEVVLVDSIEEALGVAGLR